MSKVMLSTTPVVLTTAGRARLQERLASARRAAAGTDEGSAERQRFLAEITVMEDALRQSVHSWAAAPANASSSTRPPDRTS